MQAVQAVQAVRETHRLKAPLPEPQALAWDGTTLWASSRKTHDVYALDIADASIAELHRAPGIPYGMTYDGQALHVVSSEEEDDRYLRRFVAGKGFEVQRVPCPEATGSYIGWDGARLYLTQWYRQRVIALDPSGNVLDSYTAPRQLCGCSFAQGALHVLTTDDEDTDDYFLMRLGFENGTATFEDVARVPFKARSIAWDGRRFWSNHRERDEIVAFEVPISR